MSEAGFTRSESVHAPRENLRVVWRFIRSLSLLQKLFPIYFVLMIGGAAMPQFALWLSGEYTRCDGVASCETLIPYLNLTIEVSVLLVFTLSIVAALLRITSWIVFEVGGMWSARDIHKRMVRAVSRVRTTFFDENPSGRLINRLVRDFDNLRMTGVIRLGDTLNALFEVLFAGAVLVFAHPAGFFLIFPTTILVFYIQFNVAAMLHRCGSLRSIRFGEVLHRETDVIEGSPVFVLYGKEASLLFRLRSAVSRYIQVHFLHARIEAWGRFWTGIITSIYGFAALLLIGYALHIGAVGKVLAAVLVTVIFRVPPMFGWLAWVTAYLIESVATARRVFEFVDLPEETTEEFQKPRAQARPTERFSGELAFDNYSMSYRRDSPLILNGVTFAIPEGKRTGIVGRTGVGKTSLVQSIYRMVHVQGGDIRIGGRSILDLDIDFVRSHFIVVPQDPYLFEGTIRSNLDRGKQYSDEELRKALETTGLNFQLEDIIAEGGKNLSLGERQLLCLARVMVSDKPYVFMDEPTSGVDTITDARIQELLTTALSGRTVVTIAHRLDTLSRYDHIVSLSGDDIKIGTPQEMLGV